MVLAVVSQVAIPPQRLPDLFTLLITTYSFVHFATFLLAFHYLQFTAWNSSWYTLLCIGLVSLCAIVWELAVVWTPFLAVLLLETVFFNTEEFWKGLACVCLCVCVQVCMSACFNHYANPMSIICWSLVETVIFNIKELWNSVNLWCVYMWACVHVLSTVLEVIWNPSSMNCCLSQSC